MHLGRLHRDLLMISATISSGFGCGILLRSNTRSAAKLYALHATIGAGVGYAWYALRNADLGISSVANFDGITALKCRYMYLVCSISMLYGCDKELTHAASDTFDTRVFERDDKG